MGLQEINLSHELSYDEGARRDVNSFSISEIKNFNKQQAVQYARAIGLKETGMSVNEVGMLFDLLEKKGACNIVELGRNFGCSTRMFVQHVLRRGGKLQSWDLKHWGNLKESFTKQGFDVTDGYPGSDDYHFHSSKIQIRIADSMKTRIENIDRWVDFLLIDTEHGLENALGEYMRWRGYLNGAAMVAFHDSALPAVKRAIDLAIEVEDATSPDRIKTIYKNERVDGFGLAVLEFR